MNGSGQGSDSGNGSGGRAPRRSRLPAAERRETILRAAAEVFAAAGYRAAKVSDVAARVGVTEPVIFQNFGSKAALFTAVVERAAAEASTWLDAAGPDPGSAARVLAHVLTGIPHGHPRHDPGDPGHAATSAGALLADAATLTAEPEGGPSSNAVRAVAGHLADLVRRAQADGDVRPGIDPDAAAWLLLSVLSARRLRAAAMPDDLEASVAALTLHALAPGHSAAAGAPATGRLAR